MSMMKGPTPPEPEGDHQRATIRFAGHAVKTARVGREGHWSSGRRLEARCRKSCVMWWCSPTCVVHFHRWLVRPPIERCWRPRILRAATALRMPGTAGTPTGKGYMAPDRCRFPFWILRPSERPCRRQCPSPPEHARTRMQVVRGSAVRALHAAGADQIDHLPTATLAWRLPASQRPVPLSLAACRSSVFSFSRGLPFCTPLARSDVASSVRSLPNRPFNPHRQRLPARFDTFVKRFRGRPVPGKPRDGSE